MAADLPHQLRQRREHHPGWRLVDRLAAGPALLHPRQRRRRPGAAPDADAQRPAADTSGDFNLNGIAATANGKAVIVGHSTTGRPYTVDPTSGTIMYWRV
jgi:hypothetical protein